MDIKGPVYFDTNVFIYAIEGHDAYYEWINELFQFITSKQILVITSELTLAECLVKPFKDNNQAAIDGFKEHISSNEALRVCPVSKEVLIRSASVRNELNLKLPDAIHMATAIENGCLTFISNDQKLRAPKGMLKVQLGNLAG
jgi:predicted nucleic acid-binding protein